MIRITCKNLFPLLLLLLVCSGAANPRPVKVTDLSGLPYSSPEDQGISSESILNLLHSIAMSGQEFHSLIIQRNGHIITEAYWNPYQADDTQQLYSLSKSFTSTAIGFAVDEGLVSVEDPVIKFFPENLPDTISDNLANLKVKHLLSMSVGHAQDAIRILEASPKGRPWATTFLSLPVVFEPGTQFMYNSGASYMLAAIVQKVTVQSAHEYLKPRLYEPLGIVNATWTTNDEGVNMGASHLRLSTKDISKFGQFYLQQGKWKGIQLLSRNWIRDATSKQISNGNNDNSWGYGYGYQFWLNPPGGFRADGAFGQFSMVLPDQNMVVNITSESSDTKKTMQLIWDFVRQIKTNTPLTANKEDNDRLAKQLESLKFDTPKGMTRSSNSANISGKEFILDNNVFDARSVSFDIQDKEIVFTLKTGNKPDISIQCGINEWLTGENLKPEAHSLFSLRRIDFDSKVAATAIWQDDQTLVIEWRFIETVHGDQLVCKFNGDQVNIKFRFSVARLRNEADERADLNGQSWLKKSN